jgi:hypothetical protein
MPSSRNSATATLGRQQIDKRLSQFRKLGRLEQEAIGAGSQCGCAHRRIGREHQDWNRNLLTAQGTNQIETSEVGYVGIRQHQIGWLLREGGQCLRPVFDRYQMHGRTRTQTREKAADAVVVIGNQDSGRAMPGSRFRRFYSASPAHGLLSERNAATLLYISCVPMRQRPGSAPGALSCDALYGLVAISPHSSLPSRARDSSGQHGEPKARKMRGAA